MSKSTTAKERLVTLGKGISKSLEEVTALLAENPLLLGCTVSSLRLPDSTGLQPSLTWPVSF